MEATNSKYSERNHWVVDLEQFKEIGSYNLGLSKEHPGTARIYVRSTKELYIIRTDGEGALFYTPPGSDSEEKIIAARKTRSKKGFVLVFQPSKGLVDVNIQGSKIVRGDVLYQMLKEADQVVDEEVINPNQDPVSTLKGLKAQVREYLARVLKGLWYDPDHV